jgi:hypothetical protein
MKSYFIFIIIALIKQSLCFNHNFNRNIGRILDINRIKSSINSQETTSNKKLSIYNEKITIPNSINQILTYIIQEIKICLKNANIYSLIKRTIFQLLSNKIDVAERPNRTINIETLKALLKEEEIKKARIYMSNQLNTV